MAFVPVANTCMVHVRWLSHGQRCENTFAYRWTQPPNQAQLLALATEVWQTIGVKMKRQTSTQVTFTEVYARNIDRQISEQATYTLPAGTTGERIGDGNANNVAYQATTRSGYTGRSSHGAKRFGGFVEGDTQNSQIQTALVQFMIDLFLSILAPRIVGAFLPAIASKTTGQSALMRSVVGLDVILDSQKTRLPGRGN